MRVTDVNIKLVDPQFNQPGNEQSRLRAYVTLVFDDVLLVRDFRVIEGRDGLFLASPSRSLTEKCPGCKERNPITSVYCGQCGKKIPPALMPYHGGRARQWIDIAHPVNAEFRREMEGEVLVAYRKEVERIQSFGSDKEAS